MSAATVDLGPGVERGGGRGTHDQVFLHQAQPAHVCGRVKCRGPGQDFPAHSVWFVGVLESPDVA